MRYLYLLLLCTNTLLAKSTLETLGDVGQFAIPASALVISAYKDDSQGILQLVRATALTLAITYGLKYSCNTPRPNGQRYSFPSGHSASAFAGAAYLDRRYGLNYGFPAYIAATFVGYSRIEVRAHRTIDVISAASIAYATNFFLTSRWQCKPCYTEDGVALVISTLF